MTYIEFFDRQLIENVCSSLRLPPDRVILIGENKKQMETCAARFREVLLGRGADVAFECRSVNLHNMKEIVSTLEEIVTEYDDCTVDLTGGSDLLLAASGMICERYPEKHVQLHRVSVISGAVQDCDMDGNTIEGNSFPELTVDENIRIYGGRIVYESDRADSTVLWDLDGDFCEDVDAMWRLCRKDVRLWNYRVGLLAQMDSASGAPCPEPEGSFLWELESAGLMWLENRDGRIAPVFKNEQIRKCLTVAGLVLELKIYIAASRAREKDGSPTYGDVMNGVVIDWDGRIGQTMGPDTENEIDVMMMHGMVPVFVSCKNGHVDINELYKLSTVAERFGGRYAKKILIATALEQDTPYAATLAERAKNMGIRLVDNVRYLDDEALERRVASFWR